jgi:Ca2+-binding EF-hand superfamily protein
MNFIKEQNEKIFTLIENGEDINNERLITNQTNINNDNTIMRNNYKKRFDDNNLTVLYLADKKRVTREVLNNINRLKEEANIPYKDFIQLVCENQIQNRENYLKKFVELFKRFDTDEDGILNEEQFLEMLKTIPFCQNNIEYYVEKFLNKIDPFNHRKFIFNDCVNAFSTEIIEDYNMSQSNYSKGYSEMENLNIGLNIQNETTFLDKICLGN